MCLVLYMASNRRRPEIPWDKNARALNVSTHDHGIEPVRKQFTRPHIHYVGSTSGCGCDFPHEPPWMQELDTPDPEKQRIAQQNRSALRAYLEQCLKDEEEVELYSCWSGDETLPCEHHRTIRAQDLGTPDFCLEERQLTLVRR